MTENVLVAEVAAYLEATGWRRAGTWRGASVWAGGDSRVLVPGRDDLGDNPQRIRELLATLAAVESRPARDIVRDIAYPLVDSATYRLFPADRPRGFTGLQSGLQAVSGLRDMIGAAGRVALEGPHFRFAGKAPREIGDLLERVQVGSGGTDDVAFTVLVPFTGTEERLTGRGVKTHLHDATAAVEEATRTGEIEAFDETVTAGVSADFCAALSALAGRARREPFEVGFRWSRRVRSELPARTVAFAPEAGALIRAASARLRRLDVSGAAAVAGLIEGLHDGGADRRRVRVRGELRTDRATGSRRAVWVRLAGQPDYDRAIEAHRAGLPVRAEGHLTNRTGRVELIASPGGFAVDETSPDS